VFPCFPVVRFAEINAEQFGNATNYAYWLPWCSVNKLCESRLSAYMIEERALTAKQYESVNGVKLFQVEAGLD